MTCKKAQEFLAQKKYETPNQVDAKKQTLGRREALELAGKVDEIIAAKGTKVVRLRMKDKPAEADLLAVMLGPTGNLRAPVIKQGRKLLVGFEAGAYGEILG